MIAPVVISLLIVGYAWYVVTWGRRIDLRYRYAMRALAECSRRAEADIVAGRSDWACWYDLLKKQPGEAIWSWHWNPRWFGMTRYEQFYPDFVEKGK